jgi:putative ABC transport system substrate-binding protein
MKVNVILASTTPAVSAARKATSAIPIIFVNVGDPVGGGLINSLAAPGGNITGVTNVTGELGPKHLEMLHSMAPKVSRVAVLVNPANSTHASPLKEIQAAAKRITVRILPVEARNPQEIDRGFSLMVRESAGAVVVLGDGLFNQQRRQIAELAAKNRLPSIGANREYAEAGFLMSYGVNRADNFRRAATYIDKIFKGAKPGDLPAEQPTKFELFINGKTAKALGLKIPQSLLIMADKVIE